MHDADCVDFLQWALPRLGKRWKDYRKVRGQVCKRIVRRMQELEIRSLDGYRTFLERHPDEWRQVEAACRITISRFYRDRRVFDLLFDQILPACAERCRSRSDDTLHVWSAGCASGEEPYTLAIGWRLALQERFPDLSLHITATDVQEHMLERARTGCYSAGTLKELPEPWIEAAFEKRGVDDEPFCLKASFRERIRWLQQDILETMPEGPFDGILCRNLVFMYFDEEHRRVCLERMHARLHPGGFLILGKHDALPDHDQPLEAWFEHEQIYRKTTG